MVPRAPLPAGVTNYVTPAGMAALVGERGALLAERNRLRDGSGSEARSAIQVLNAKLQALEARIASAVVVDPALSSGDTVRFGATITLQGDGEARLLTYQIVGVDEADVARGKISFISPIARAMMNRAIGDEVSIKLPTGARTFELVNVAFDA